MRRQRSDPAIGDGCARNVEVNNVASARRFEDANQVILTYVGVDAQVFQATGRLVQEIDYVLRQIVIEIVIENRGILHNEHF